MSVLEKLEPSRVFKYFEEIASIPHGSRNTKAISDYVAEFAENQGLIYYQDDSNNVIIYKAGQNGGEDSESVIMQGHLDMVCEKTEDCDIDFEKDGLSLIVNDGMISAEGTTLGGDDGIAVAYMLAILEDTEMTHPPLECVFTVDEEIGMLGAEALDKTRLMGKRLLNIDSEEEGHLLVSCAGGATVTMNIPILRRGAQGERYRFTVSGLVGGHSGVEIDKGRASADILMGKALQEMLYADDSLRIINVIGGLKDNAIPVKAEAEFVTKNADVLEKLVPELQVKVREEYGKKDPDITFSIASVDKENDEYTGIYPIDEMQNMQLIMLLSSAPFGVRTYSSDIEGLVQTSLNLGIMNTGAEAVTITYSVRSSVEEEKQQLIDELETLARSVGGTVIVDGIYPAWEYRKESVVRDVMTELYEEMYGKPMIVEAIHAGLECGIFSGAISGLDAVSFGPDILDIHTPKERMNIDSVARTWDFVKEVLVRLC